MANLKGGYAMVDCKGLNLLADAPQTISGLRKAVKAAYESNKPIIACNCVYGAGVPLTPIQVFEIEETGVYIMTASILQVRVHEGDVVTIENLLTMGN